MKQTTKNLWQIILENKRSVMLGIALVVGAAGGNADRIYEMIPNDNISDRVMGIETFIKEQKQLNKELEIKLNEIESSLPYKEDTESQQETPRLLLNDRAR